MIIQEPKTKKAKKNTNIKEEQAPNESKSTKKPAQAKKAAATTSNEPTTSDEKKKPNSLDIHDLRVGTGPEAKLGKNVNQSFSFQ